MNKKNISKLRLINQQVVDPRFHSASELVSWMGMMQAQDLNMAKWALGVRLPGSTEDDINTAIDKGDILRTHVLRPTWHFVSPRDIYWMLDLSAEHIKTAMRSRDKQLELDDAVYKRSNAVIEKALSGGNHLTRAELGDEIEKSGISLDNSRIAHMLVRAEVEKIICSGAMKGKQATYALLSERVEKQDILTHDEALTELAVRYFSSHGPATLKDFIWWSGLSVKEARQALDSLKSDFIFFTVDDETYWFSNVDIPYKTNKQNIHLLPAFDEFIISYRDRTAAILSRDHTKAVSNNGVFRPVIVQNGAVVGIWKRSTKNDKISLSTEYFIRESNALNRRVEKAFELYADFSGLKYVRIPDN
ncbi:winged helix DNA-binding domain-containing protein [Saccharicrinis sp. FJH54]|uniref:winged helix DNA-binding domain-containing protein n=1 Tax=Saccharicrinis sp. FJH54 TaxID=3344665 RepID=UPI0035D4270D